jgi:hypothetical protein
MADKKKSDKYEFMAKVIIIGVSGIAKTNLITRFYGSFLNANRESLPELRGETSAT